MTAFSIPANYAFETYDDLVAALNDWLDRADLTGVAGQMVALAEARIRRSLNGYFLEASALIAVVDGSGALPDDFGSAVTVVHDGKVLPQYAPSIGQMVAAGSIPLAYSIEAGALRLWPSTDASVTLLYQQSLPALTSLTQTNDILDRHPDVYFFGAMLFAEGYLANDNRAVTFKNLFDEAIFETRQYLISQKFGGPLVPRLGAP